MKRELKSKNPFGITGKIKIKVSMKRELKFDRPQSGSPVSVLMCINEKRIEILHCSRRRLNREHYVSMKRELKYDCVVIGSLEVSKEVYQ